MGNEKFTIVVDNPTNSYFPGQVVSGRFNVELESTHKVKEIKITFKGKAHCEWSEGGGQNQQYYSNKEYYFKSNQTLYGKEQTHQDEFELHQGHHSYPFSFQIPSNVDLPPSFDDQSNYVRYRLKATIVRPWSSNKHAKHVVNMICPVNLNNIRNQDVTMPGEWKGDKTICCLCCESNPITAFVRTDRRGYVPGDTITFNAEINNMSGRRMKYSKAQLIMKVRLTASWKSRDYINKFDKIYHGSIEAGGTDVYRNEKILIPSVPPSYLPGCKVINVWYYVSIVVKPTGPALRLRVNSEVVIGSIPLQSVAADLGLTLPPLGGPTGSSDLINETVLAKMPQASIQESVFGDALKKKKKELSKGETSTRFVPSYIYYKWNQQNPVDLFTTQY